MKQKKYLSVVFFAVVFALVGSISASACQEGSFRDFDGEKNVRLNNAYTYSVFAEGEFKNVNFSATGGEVLNTWNEGNKFFAEVRWTQNDPNDPTKLKVYGEDGCGNMQDLRYMMNVSSSRSPDPESGASKGAIRLFDRVSGKGDSFVATRDVIKLAPKWNDKIRSVWVGQGVKITLYEDADFKGRSMQLTGEGDGTMFNLPEIGFDKITSSFDIE